MVHACTRSQDVALSFTCNCSSCDCDCEIVIALSQSQSQYIEGKRIHVKTRNIHCIIRSHDAHAASVRARVHRMRARGRLARNLLTSPPQVEVRANAGAGTQGRSSTEDNQVAPHGCAPPTLHGVSAGRVRGRWICTPWENPAKKSIAGDARPPGRYVLFPRQPPVVLLQLIAQSGHIHRMNHTYPHE